MNMDERTDTRDELTAEQQRLSELCGSPPLVDGEDAERYQRLLAGIVKAVQPVDVPEWLWVRDIVDLQWEILRYRSAKAHLISSAEAEARRNLLLDDAVDRFSSSDISDPAIIAHAIAARITDLRRFDLMLMSMEFRRDNAYREIEQRRGSPGKRQRAAGQMRAYAPALIENQSEA